MKVLRELSTAGLSRALAMTMAASVTLTWVGCTDAIVDPVQTAPSDPYAVQSIDPAFADAFSEIPSFESIVAGTGLGKLSDHHDTSDHGNPPSDTTTHHDPPADTTVHQPPPDSSDHQPPADTSEHNPPPHNPPPHDPPPHDTTAHDSTHHHAGSAELWRDLTLEHDISILRPHSYAHAPAELQLSHEQDSLLRLAIAAYASSVNSAYHDYIAQRRARLAVLNHELHELHDAMRSGRMTEDQGRDRMHELVAAYKADVAVLGETLTAAVSGADSVLDTEVRRFLSDAQYDAWVALKHG